MIRVAAVALSCGCGGPEPAAPGPPAPQAAAPAAAAPPSVVLVTIDTLRADHLGLYGHSRPTSPWLDQLAAQGAVFEQATSTSSWTPPAMASLMTGVHPHQHGYDTAAVQSEVVAAMPVLSPDHRTLAEHLQAAGLTTWAITTNHHLDADRGFGQGVQFFRGLGMTDDGNRAVTAIEQAAGQLTGAGPTLLWAHLLDPHGPYWRMEPHASAFDVTLEAAFPGSAQTREARLQAHHTVAVGGIEDPDRYPAGSVELATLQALYDSEIRHTDALVQRIAAVAPPSPDRLWVVTADHGEEFREHGNLGHRNGLYEHQVRVPLLVVWPGHVPPQRISTPVSLVDVLPTVVELVTGQAPAVPPGGGRSLAPALLAGEEPAPRPLLAEVRQPRGGERMVRDGDWKLRLPEGQPPILVDLGADPAEQGPPVDDAATVARLTTWLADHDARAKVLPALQVEEALSDDERAQLEAMGYLDEAPPPP